MRVLRIQLTRESKTIDKINFRGKINKLELNNYYQILVEKSEKLFKFFREILVFRQFFFGSKRFEVQLKSTENEKYYNLKLEEKVKTLKIR